MSWLIPLRRGEDIAWRALKPIARRLLAAHLPVGRPLRPLVRTFYRLHVVGRETAIFFVRFCWYEPLFRGQCEAIGGGFWMEQLPYMSGRGRIIIGRGVRLSGKPSIAFSSHAAEPPVLMIGDGTFIGHQTALVVGESIVIGRRCLIAGGVHLADFDGHPIEAARRSAGAPTPREQIRPITIGDDVWIGAGAMILKGVTVGARSVVAARSVVTKDVPPDVIVAGNPARVVRELCDSSSDDHRDA